MVINKEKNDMKKVKKIAPILVLSLIFVLSTGVSANASDDNIPFNFRIKAGYQNTYTDSRYRQTSITSNPWKVDLVYSAEGAGTYTTFWLSLFNSDHTCVSGTHDVKAGSGAHYYSAYSGASLQNVCMGAENNNYSGSTYIVSGYWDEETY